YPAFAPEFTGFHVPYKAVQPFVVEAQTVDQSLGFRQAEHPGFGIASLGPWRYRAHLHKAKAQRGKGVDAGAVLVEPGGQPHRVAKVQIHHPNWRQWRGPEAAREAQAMSARQ